MFVSSLAFVENYYSRCQRNAVTIEDGFTYLSHMFP